MGDENRFLVTSRGTEFEVGLVADHHRLPGVTLGVEGPHPCPLRLRDYLTPDEAERLAAKLTEAAATVREREQATRRTSCTRGAHEVGSEPRCGDCLAYLEAGVLNGVESILAGCRPLLAAVDAQRGTISARTRAELERGAAKWERREQAKGGAAA